MFTGIIEAAGKVQQIEKEGSNLHLVIEAPFVDELKIDQSIAHNGVCLTVVEINNGSYRVTAIKETLERSNLRLLKPNDVINLERSMKLGERMDGHIVQGHVDETAVMQSVEELDGSWLFHFQYDAAAGNITVEKGSISVNGVSLTVVDSNTDHFSVAIIPYTFEHTNFGKLINGDMVNLEFDIIGKYVAKLLKQ